jgi:hypothetical protein
MSFFSVGKGGMNAPRDIGNCTMIPVHCTSTFSCPYDAMNFMGIRILLANSCTRWRGTFKGLSQDGGLTDFSKNLRASLTRFPILFSTDAEPIVSQICLQEDL